MPNNVRELLTKERIGNIYMRYLAFLTFLSLSLIGFEIFGFSPVNIAVPLIVLIIGFFVIVFVKLGKQAFNLFDPTSLSDPIFVDINKYLMMAQAGGFQWNDPSFQNHTNQQAKGLIDTLKTIADIVGNRDSHLNGRSFTNLSKHVIKFLCNYQGIKKHIPFNSRWYEQQYIQNDWYLTDDTETSIANQNGITIFPKIESNMYWIEEKLLPIILDCIRINLDLNRFDFVQELLSYYIIYLENLARNKDLIVAFEYLESISDEIFGNILFTKNLEVNNEILEALAIAEKISSIPISLLLAYMESINKISRGDISSKMSKINWKRPNSLYAQGFNSYTLERLV